jgi:hypothetical protein
VNILLIFLDIIHGKLFGTEKVSLFFFHIVVSINSKYHMVHQEPVSMLMALEVLQNLSEW